MDEDLKSYFDGQFSSMREHFDGQIQQLRQEMNQEFKEVKGDVREFKGDVQELKGDVQELKGDIQELKGDVRQLKGDVQELKGDVQQAYVLIENVHGQVRLVADGVANCNEQLQRHREEVSGKLDLCEDLDLRVRRLEAAGDLPPTGSLRRSRAR